jgi:hypothetical protein
VTHHPKILRHISRRPFETRQPNLHKLVVLAQRPNRAPRAGDPIMEMLRSEALVRGEWANRDHVLVRLTAKRSTNPCRIATAEARLGAN